MDHAAFHERLDAIAADAAVLARDGDPVLAALERHASGGCSVCARALVNAREGAVLLAAAGAVAVAPSGGGLRERVLASARRRLPAIAAPLTDHARVLDASAAVAHLHLGAPDEAARARAVSELDALDALDAANCDPARGSGEALTLAEVARLIGYPVLFISVIRGERVGYRAQHGLPPDLLGARHIRREMTFCTHCASAGAPLVVEDAASEPFFRGSKMVQRYGMRAYVGVPLRTSAGIILGTLCALDWAPRRRDDDLVRILELYAAPVAARMERRPGAAPERTSSGAPIHPAPWFARLLDLELARAARGRPATLVTLAGPGSREAAALAAPGEVLGAVPGGIGVLLSGAGAGTEAGAERFAAFRAVCPGAAYALAEPDGAAGARWAAPD